ncbi:type 1 periplasmic binding fold superfamily protein [uncultured Winogradskyella sp.]|uniref:type 1 periplasmic binding fold superfamily protein n=1 Tax=uncultured Winogradskyella sp. TaxID=395353 RepID=UPI00261E2239|nr:type 1 periplasmic binding fold superfamily protein [uncultured Winogradskyella sp.]
MKTIKLLALFFISGLAMTSCSSDDDGGENDEELITTVVLTLTNTANAADIVTLTFTDLDGEGGNEPVYTPAVSTLSTNTTYTGSIQLWNATENPPEDVNEEIVGEADEHEFFYTPSVAGMTVVKTDTDGDGNPLGIETTVTTGTVGTGGLNVVLRHEPSKPNDGTLAGAGGSTDVEVNYSISVQ